VKPGGLIVVVEANRPVRQHGMPPNVLRCEFAALGMKPVKAAMLSSGENYLMAFRIAAPRPAPDKIQTC
jgi:hypothetical protein